MRRGHFIFVYLSFVLCMAGVTSPASAQEGSQSSLYGHADLSSPKDALETFVSTSERGTRLILEAYRQRREEGGLFPSPSVREQIEQAELLLDTAARTLDLSEIPPAVLEHEKIEIVLQLREILRRLDIPSLSDVPDADALKAAATADQPISEWRLPNTELILVQVEDGTRRGDFVFSAGSVSRVPALYEAALASPSGSESTNIYEFYRSSPGRLLPPIWYEYIRQAPDWMHATIADQAVWQWLALGSWTLLSLAVLVWAVRKRWSGAKQQSTASREVRQALLPLMIVILSVVFLVEVIDQINLTGRLYLFADAAGQVLLAFGLAWLIVLGGQAMAELIIRSPSILPDSLDAHLLRASFRVIGLTLALFLLGYTATRLGIPLLGVLAGLGVGGLAIALAAQPTIENFIGGVILFADRPVRTGEFCRCGDVMGTVEGIGLRSTRIRALDRTLVSIPNSEFAKARIVNFARRDQQLFEAKIGIRFEASRADLEKLLTAMRALLEARPKVVHETVRVRMGAIGGSALEIDLRAYFQIADFEEFLAEKEELLLSLMELVEDNGCSFAFPSQTLYLARDLAPSAKAPQSVRT